MYYSYKPFTLNHVNYQQIINEFPNSLWIAGYPSYNVTPEPLYNYFPSMDGVAIWQFTSMSVFCFTVRVLRRRPAPFSLPGIPAP